MKSSWFRAFSRVDEEEKSSPTDSKTESSKVNPVVLWISVCLSCIVVIAILYWYYSNNS